MGRLKFLRSFQLKATIALILAMVFPLLLSNFFICKFTSDASFEALRNRLKIVAQLGAELVDPKLIAAVPLNPSGIQSPAFLETAAKLNKIKSICRPIKYAYILKPTETPGMWQFIVDPSPSEKRAGQWLTSYPGDLYDASRFPDMIRAMQEPAADHKLEVDEWGVTLSGYAPILDDQGKAIAVLGVDILATDLYQMQQGIKQRTVLIIIISLCFCLLLGTMISGRVSGPIHRLAEAARRIGNGDLHYQVRVESRDEIGELAQSFNKMSRGLRLSRRRMVSYFYKIIRMLVQLMEIKDHYTRGHSEEVARYSAKIAIQMGLPKTTVKLFRRMTLLHDIGKLGVKDNILNKKDPLTPEEWEEIKRHPMLGVNILKPLLGSDVMLAVVGEHHERQDGKGYPQHLKSDEINFFSAIVSVADAYSAMTTHRAYRPALSKEEAIAELKRHCGTQFHPDVVQAFLKVLEAEEK